MEYSYNAIEKKWQERWKKDQTYTVDNNSTKPKCYVLDMFPYPSGTGLHVGHPLGYIASDIYARYKRLKGFNVLHPMGYDAFGLPAEQYALDHGIHPAVSTKQNIQNFRDQLDRIGFSYDWSRQVNTAEPQFYKWTQWIFLQLFNSWYNRATNSAAPIGDLIAVFEKNGSESVSGYRNDVSFSADKWKAYSEKQQQDILMEFRLAYCGIGEVNWCEVLGTVLANDEVINGFSERGGHPVIKKKLRQWYLRITEYADRLLDGLETVAFSDAMKEMQTNWIGKSYGAEIDFAIAGNEEKKLRVYTTRPDTMFGVDFMVIAPEHELIAELTNPEEKNSVEQYIAYVKSRSERERMAEKKITGCFTGSYVLNPFDGRKIPVWISEYVLAGYGTGAIMAVPCGDERDFKFASHFNIPVTNIIGEFFNGTDANATKDARLENSGFLNGIVMRDAIEIVIGKLEQMGIGNRRVNYRMRDAAFSRQRYWGEPFPIIWKNGIAYPLDEKDLPLTLPEVDSYKPGPEGEGPLANVPEWTSRHLETNTMPGFAGSSWYFLRYMDPNNAETFCSRSASDYWNQVDLYIGGTEHAVGHLLYSRMWTKFLFDKKLIGFDEPYKKLVNQGMIQGSSRFVYRIEIKGSEEMEVLAKEKPIFISAGLKNTSFAELQSSIQTVMNEKWGTGYRCIRCGCKEFVKGKTWYFKRCRVCKYDESVTANTLFHKCKLELLKVFEMGFRISVRKKGMSTNELAREFGCQQKTAWLLKAKFQNVMKSSNNHPLEEEVEVDEFLVGGMEEGKQGRSHGKKSLVVLAIEKVKDKKGNYTVGRAYAKVIKTASTNNLEPFFEDKISKLSSIETDGWAGYIPLKKDWNIIQKLSKMGKGFPKLHTHIMNIKSWLRGIHHKCDSSRLQNYLDEFHFRFNRRSFLDSILEKLLEKAISHQPIPYKSIRCELNT